MYVDDGVSGSDPADVDRMVGKLQDNANYDGTLSHLVIFPSRSLS